MVTKKLPEEEPENNDKLAHQNQTADSHLVTRKFQSIPAFDLSDEDTLDEMRRAMIRMDTNGLVSDESESPDELNHIDSHPGLELDTSNKQTERFEASFPNSDPTGIDFTPPVGEQNNYPYQNFSPFDESIFTGTPAEPIFLSPGDLDEKTEQKNPDQNQDVTWSQINAHNAGEDDITQRINALRTETTQNISQQTSVTPPFVIDDNLDPGENNNTLTEKIKRGLVPSETLQLLITKTMSEADVISISKELGIDWNLTPGETREEKTEFLIGYFKNNTNIQNREVIAPENSEPQFLIRNTEEDWRESDSRLQALQESLTLPETPVIQSAEKASFFSHLKDEFEHSSALAKGLMIGLSIFAVILIFVITYFLFMYKKITPIPTTPIPITAISNQSPYPKMLQLPGGWIFDLRIGSVQDGNWNLSDAEWLQGTEICRLVSLPWNKQLNAVFQTFTTGDKILLTMSNRDLLIYNVEATREIKLNELNQLINRDSPSLIIVLTQNETDARQVIVAVPDYSKESGAAIVTVTTASSLAATVTPTPLQIAETPAQTTNP